MAEKITHVAMRVVYEFGLTNTEFCSDDVLTEVQKKFTRKVQIDHITPYIGAWRRTCKLFYPNDIISVVRKPNKRGFVCNHYIYDPSCDLAEWEKSWREEEDGYRGRYHDKVYGEKEHKEPEGLRQLSFAEAKEGGFVSMEEVIKRIMEKLADVERDLDHFESLFEIEEIVRGSTE